MSEGSDKALRLFYIRGFGDGAKGITRRHPYSRAYMDGWRAGCKSCTESADRYCEEQNSKRSS
jgi:hypothetical protein